MAEVVGALNKKPAVVGHSFGGLITQNIAGRGLSAATVAVDPAPFKGVLPLPLAALRTTLPVQPQPAQPRPRGHPHARPVSLRLGQRGRRGGGKARCYEEFHVAAPGVADLPGGDGEPQPEDRDQGRQRRTRIAARC